ncbi:MAG TPA: OmpA family protein [Prolixibacteraceae bacterium]|nr:OmpA family protein [Prolixibacteraceae bacterium]
MPAFWAREMNRKAFTIFFLIPIVLGLIGRKGSAQDSIYPWSVKASYNVLQYRGELGEQLFNPGFRNDGAFLGATRYLNPSLDVEMGIGYNRLGLEGSIDEKLYRVSGHLFSPQLAVHYKFSNGYLLSEQARLQPWIGAGISYFIGQTSGDGYDLAGAPFTHFVDELAFSYSVGIQYRVFSRVSVFLEIKGNLATTEELDGAAIDRNNDRYRGAALGLIIKLGGPKDSDKDGVYDPDDECPDTPLGVEVDSVGCPKDRDKDGIPDYQDDCPDDPGLPEYNGCPDRDGDGIIDKVDDCPDLPGIPKYNGCPDSDGDGVIDPRDLCPDTPQGIEVDEYGCPIDSDGDGLFDDVDQCPDEFGPMEYLGCPEPIPVEWPEMRQETPSEVYFETDKYELDSEAEKGMQDIVKFLFENPMMNIRLYGSADPRGSKEYNEVLSARRVETVKKYLIRKGIPESRIIVKALGETQEVRTEEGEEQMNLDQKLRKYRKVQFDTFFFMK